MNSKTTILRHMPMPTVESALARLIDAGLNITTVIDVGVQAGTSPLMEAFPKAKHHLLEPVDLYFDTIRQNYRSIDYELHHLAVSSSSGNTFQIGVSMDNSSRVTHSHISDKNISVGQESSQGTVIECKAVRKITLDDFFIKNPIKGKYLVKIDVDGHEMPIIQGGQATLQGADIVIVEASMDSLLDRANAITQLGLNLVEIVDCCYYYRLLSQVDLIFINKNLIIQCPDLRPWATKEFSYDHWQKYTPWRA